MTLRPTDASLRFRNSAMLILMMMLCTLMVQGQARKQSETLRQSKQKLDQEIRYTNDLLQQTRKNKQTSLDEVKILGSQVRSRERFITSLNDEIRDTEDQIALQTRKLDQMTGQLTALRLEYARMIRQAYRTMNGNSRLMFIFASDDFNQAWLRLRYLRQYGEYRRNQAARIDESRRQVDRQRLQLDSVRAVKLDLIGAKTSELRQLEQERKAKDKAVKELSSKEKQLASTLKNKQKAAEKLNAEIRKAINDEIRAAEELQRKKDAKAAPAKGSAAGKSSSPATAPRLGPEEVKLSGSFAANRGKLPWPTERGFISENFGEHKHPVLKHVTVKNNGIDIMTDPGAPVRAVFDGRVTKVMNFQQLNRVVIIRHGDYLTVYSNLGEVSIREGDEVKARQVIGTVAPPADDQRPELHFELWQGKTILNPESWLIRR